MFLGSLDSDRLRNFFVALWLFCLSGPAEAFRANIGFFQLNQADVTPNPLTFSDMYFEDPATASSGVQTISGISTSINLRFVADLGGSALRLLRYRINAGSWVSINGGGSTTVTVTFNNNDTLEFEAGGYCYVTTLHVYNSSDNDSLLDSIFIQDGCSFTP